MEVIRDLLAQDKCFIQWIYRSLTNHQLHFFVDIDLALFESVTNWKAKVIYLEYGFGNTLINGLYDDNMTQVQGEL